jgi:hypothetical protein
MKSRKNTVRKQSDIISPGVLAGTFINIRGKNADGGSMQSEQLVPEHDTFNPIKVST